MKIKQRNNLDMYDDVATLWWSDKIRWVRTLKNLVPGRLSWFDRHIDWNDKTVLDLGCAGGFMSEALTNKGACVTGIDPATEAIKAANARAKHMNQAIQYDVGVGESLPYPNACFDAVVCVDVLEHVSDLTKVLAEVVRVLKPGGTFLYDTINRNPISRLAAITLAEDILRILPQGTHDPKMFIKPHELCEALSQSGLILGLQTGLGPRAINRHGDIVFGQLSFKTIIYMGFARLPESSK